MNEVVVQSSDDRKNRAIILDSKLDDTLLNLFIYSAELVDNKLYQELGFTNAKEYFEAKAISVSQAYRYAFIGRAIKPEMLNDSKAASTAINSVGVRKIEEIVRRASDQLPQLLSGSSIFLGDEEYTLDDLKETSFKDVSKELKNVSKKLEDYELISEQKKNVELQNQHLEKKVKNLEEKEEKYREYSATFDEIDKDLAEASKSWERTRVLMNRIDSENMPEQLGLRLKTLIETIQRGAEDIPLKHQMVLLSLEEDL